MPVHRPRPPAATHVADRRREDIRALVGQPVHPNHGTRYPCTREDIAAAITANPRRRVMSELVSANRASHEIWAHNARGRNLGQSEYHAIIRLENFMRDFYSGRLRWGPDLIIKAFSDLDKVFFLGLLRGPVRVKWKSAAHFDPPTRHRVIYGKTEYLGGAKAVILLNADAIFGPYWGLNPFKETWRTMLHEMWYVMSEQLQCFQCHCCANK